MRSIEELLALTRGERASAYRPSKRTARIKPGRHVVNGVLCFDGSGGSGHTGTCSAQALRGDQSKVTRLFGQDKAASPA